MKKVLTILLIALCCVSVFAADVSASVSFKMSFDKDGYHFVPYPNGLAANGITLSVYSEGAGGSIKIVPTRFERIDIDLNLWAQPGESLKYTIGARPSISLKDGFDISEMASYCVVDYTFNGQPNGLGFLYQPKDNALFVAGVTNIPLTSFGVLHADVLTKLDMDGYKPSLNYALGELTYCNSLNPSDLCAEAGYTKDSINSKFGDTENEFFNYQSDWNFHNTQNFGSRLSAGLRFKHYSEFAKEKENGLYGYGFVQYSIPGLNRFNAEAEVGRNVAGLKLSNFYTNDGFGGIVNAIADFDWSNGSFNAKLDEVVGWASYQLDEVVGWASYQLDNFKPKLSVDYLNKDTNTAEENGFFVTPEVDFNIGTDAVEARVKLGLDSLNDFQWDASFNNTFNF